MLIPRLMENNFSHLTGGTQIYRLAADSSLIYFELKNKFIRYNIFFHIFAEC